MPFLLARLLRNPLEVWTRSHFEDPIVRHDLPFAQVAVVSDPAGVRRVLMENAENYRKDSLQRRVLGVALREGLLTAEGRQWREQRRAIAPMFSRRHVMNAGPAMVAAADALVARWRARRDANPLFVGPEMSRFTLDVLVRTIFSDGLGGEPDEVLRAMKEYFDAIGRIDPFDILDLPESWPRLTRFGARGALRFFDGAVKTLIRDRSAALAERGDEVPQDLLTLLLTARDPETGRGMTESEIKANILTFIAAGNETAANALTWAVMLLSMSPDWRDIVRAEAETAWDGPQETVTDRMPMTRAVIEETLRLYPSIVAISREAVAEDEICGSAIRPGSMVVVCPYVLHRHRALWPDADAFDPSRFVKGRSRHDRFSWIPFGVGPRICIGSAFALQEITILLSKIVQNFDLALPEGHQVKPVLRVTLKPSCGLPMHVHAR